MFTKREELAEEETMAGALGDSNHAVLEFLTLRERKAKDSHMYCADFKECKEHVKFHS